MMDLDRVNAYMERVKESEHTTFHPVSPKLKTGLDLGTAYIALVVLDEEDNPIACEKQAAGVLKDGVVVDYTGALNIVRELKKKLEGRLDAELLNCAIAMPAGTESSARTHQYVAEGAGFEVTAVLDEPSAANAIYQIQNGVIVDIGGGTTEVAVISLGGIVAAKSVRVGGDKFDIDIINYIKKKYNLLIGERTAENIKIEVGNAFPLEEELITEIKGRNLLTGLPENITVSSVEIREALIDTLQEVLEAIRVTLEKTPPELAADIIDQGIVLTGGGALLRGLDKLIAQETGMNVHAAADPLDCVALGSGAVLEGLDKLSSVFSTDDNKY